MSFHLLRFFWLKIQQYYNFGKTKEKNKETGYFENKTLSSFRKASSTKIEGAKYPGDSRVACVIYLSYPLHSNCVGLNAKLAVFILQMHCQMKLRGSPCSVFSCCNPKISTTVSAEIVFFLWVPWFIVRLQRFWRASSIPLFLHLSKSFSVMTFSNCNSSLHWLKPEVIFSWVSERSLVLDDFSVFWRHVFGLFLKENSSSRKSAFFYWWLAVAFTPTLAFLFTSELGFTF